MTGILERLAARRKLVDTFALIGDFKPLIHDVAYLPGYTRYIFTIPNGMNPKMLNDKYFAFQQIFGENITLKGTHKKYTLTVYRKSLPKEVAYKYSAWLGAITDKALPVVVGIDQRGQKVAYDLAQQPHLLLSGETGSGKSSLLRAILTTLMLSRKPSEVRFVLGDLKRSEFGIFRSMPHVDGVHVQADEIERALMLVTAEMQRRGSLLDDAEVAHIKDLPTPLPYLIVAIDEVALLRKEKTVMAMVEDISSVGRSLGVLLILSMQRPDANVLEGRLKNNLTVRISGRQSDSTNAKVAGVPGAERIKPKDHGRMVYLADEPLTIQAPWLSFDEAKRLLAPLKVKKKQPNKPRKEVIDAEPPTAPQFNFGLLGGVSDATE